jgi:hypothetical protein
MASFLLPSHHRIATPNRTNATQKTPISSGLARKSPFAIVVPSFWKEGLGVVEKNTVFSNFYRSSIVCLATTPHPSSPEEGTTN